MKQIYNVFYEFDDRWHIAGTIEAETKFEAISKVKEASIIEICLKHVVSPDYVRKKMNFDVGETV
ncbi:hypothetical protein GCM10010912_68660 [Paenibacillus albidus]|uniref:Uncharacterized protein n=1 Tax=Paenibacillus albidus TaxID=2041023 RepID=A0A917FYR2_9BACL|nr:hypothetical protein [Paenibacillus albidus]GGG14463.1 hypothetical protein GCM10010912_68660 [Paenibacillus albidus]